ncbi:fimbrillin family protein [Prevotella sp. MA2016]|uniref:fimbrillin family protein n=1 Tax=Prevotella sp. MA2016 TaxID=1408310 RepID=UPI00048D5464|nr:fimbrillin family protein [Prevotella sp. MA2016]
MKNLLYPLVFATAFVATACTSTNETDFDTPVDPNGKTAISFSVEEQRRALTRAGFTDITKIAMRIKSEATGKANRYTRTVATAAAASGKDYSSITVDGAYVRYWDDAYGRAANLSVFAIAVPNKDDIKNDEKSLEEKLTAGTDTWFTETTENEKISWKISTTQTSTTLDDEDLTYSNNIKDGGTGGVYQYDFTQNKYPNDNTSLSDGRMQFRLQTATETDGPGKFDKGHLMFNHALSRITVNLKKGDGYPTTGAFEFTNGTSVKILNVPVSGDLDLTNGTWSNRSLGDIVSMYQKQKAATGAVYTLMAQILPDYVISATSTTNMLTFTIDDNQYFITQQQMYDALKDATGMTKKDASEVTMEQGLNYNFTITVKKTNIINVTAVVQPWSDVNAEEFTPSNARITLDGIYDSNSGKKSTDFTLYRVLDESDEITDTYVGKKWNGNYTDAATLAENTDGSWSTNWYFESNKAYYHFRTVNEGITIEGTSDTDNSVADYFIIEAGPVASTDPHWGAPMTNEPVYNVTNGYTDCLSSAIGATNAKINITDQHMMSNITVKLQTTDGNDKVTLAGAKVYITKLHTTGNVLMGTGLVTPTGNVTAQQEMTGNNEGTEFTYAIVPQALVRATTNATDDDYVGITIVTADNNQYYIVKKLSEITASTVSNVKSQTQGSAIKRWFPGHTYTYTFTLKKAGIDKITCTVEGWTDVTADNKNISLED